jgi:branched-chain amino acid transport system ATP-binding protein
MTGVPAAITVRNITMRFAEFAAVNDVSLQLEAGERRALIGPNGAGKTTLFNVISARLKPSAGEVLFYGTSIADMSADRICRLGLVRTFQITSIYPQLTCLQNVQVALFAHNGHARWLLRNSADIDAEAALGCLAAVGIERLESSLGANLSYGDQKRLELALALALEPKVLLLDEPTAGVESKTRRELVELIKQLCAQKALTLLFCEHDMDAVFSIADRITVLHQGRILAEGNADEIQSNPEVRRIYLGADHVATAHGGGGR